jgi:hypothetical protein
MSRLQGPQTSVPDNPSLPANRKTQARIRRFMANYVRMGDVRAAAKSARFSLATHYRMLETSDSYRQSFAMAQEQLADALEAEAFRRALNGSDELLVFLLLAAGPVPRAHRPGAFRRYHAFGIGCILRPGSAGAGHLDQSGAGAVSKGLGEKMRTRVPVFLEAYRTTASVAAAARIAGISRRTHYMRLENDEAYRKACALAQTEVADVIEGELFRRAVHGEKEPVFFRGKKIATITRRSVGLLGGGNHANRNRLGGCSADSRCVRQSCPRRELDRGRLGSAPLVSEYRCGGG